MCQLNVGERVMFQQHPILAMHFRMEINWQVHFERNEYCKCNHKRDISTEYRCESASVHVFQFCLLEKEMCEHA